MAVTVRIPTPLRRATNGKDRVELECASLGECIDLLEERFPGFKARLIADSGDLHRFVNVYINGEDVRFLQGLETPTRAGDEVSIVPAVAGG